MNHQLQVKNMHSPPLLVLLLTYPRIVEALILECVIIIVDPVGVNGLILQIIQDDSSEPRPLIWLAK